MRNRLFAVLATAILAFALTGLGGKALAQQPEEDEELATCVQTQWESTEVTVDHEGLEDFEIGGGSGVSLTIDEDGSATADFSGMDPITFEGEVQDTTLSGTIEYRGEATGTVSTQEDATEEDANDENANDETRESGTLQATDVNWEDVQLTVVITEPFDGRPVDRVAVADLQELAERHGHTALTEPVLTQSTYECENETLTLTSTPEEEEEEENQDDEEPRDEAEVTWTFERPTDEEENNEE